MDLEQGLFSKRVLLGCGSERTAQGLLNPESFWQCPEIQWCGTELGLDTGVGKEKKCYNPE